VYLFLVGVYQVFEPHLHVLELAFIELTLILKLAHPQGRLFRLLLKGI
jgi:hypothetical protein